MVRRRLSSPRIARPRTAAWSLLGLAAVGAAVGVGPASPASGAPSARPTASASTAKGTHYSGAVEDDLGDSKAASLDIAKVSFDYWTDGTVRIKLVTNLAMNPKKHDAQFVALLGGSQCSKPLAGGGGQLSMAKQAVVFKPKSFTAFGKFLTAKGKLSKTTYTVTAKYAKFAHQVPDCFSGAIIDPKHANKVIDDVVVSPIRPS